MIGVTLISGESRRIYDLLSAESSSEDLSSDLSAYYIRVRPAYF